MRRRRIAVVAVAAALGVFRHDDAWAHAGLRLSNPAAASTLGDSPKLVQLTFWEKPEPSLTIILVLDTAGTAYQIGRPEPVPGAPLSLAVPVRPLEKGVYTVSWRTLSSVDGHATAGAFAFGVLVKPTGPGVLASNTYPEPSALEMAARFTLIVGLVALLGAAAAGVARFGGPSDLALGAGGWLLALFGLVLLAEAQRRNAAASFTVLLGTAVGRALMGRALALAAAGALLLARSAHPRIRAAAPVALALASSAAVAVHVAAGHAGAFPRQAALMVAAQWAHFMAVGVWLGGLAALLLGVRGAPSDAKASAVRRFSEMAAFGLVVVIVTGIARTAAVMSSWRDLTSTGYGRAVLVKIALITAIAALGALNRWRSVPAAARTLRPLRLAGGGELGLAVSALLAAAVLGTLPPPGAGSAGPLELVALGSDFGTTVRARLTAVSDQPGPNRFVVRVVDYDSNRPVRARRVSLRFLPLDDPGEESTSLSLEPGPGDSYVGSGANLAFDGRWRVTVLIERAGDSAEVPLQVETRSPPRFVSTQRIPGQPPQYTVQVSAGEFVRISPDPEKAGRSRVHVSFFDMFGDEHPMEGVVVTAAAGEGPARQLPVQRSGPSRFVAEVDLRPGSNTIAAVARAADGTRLRAAVTLDVPAP